MADKIKQVYYKDRDTGNIVRYTRGVGVEYLKEGALEWKKCGSNSNYHREIFIGEGNNCLDRISEEEASLIISKWKIKDN